MKYEATSYRVSALYILVSTVIKYSVILYSCVTSTCDGFFLFVPLILTWNRKRKSSSNVFLMQAVNLVQLAIQSDITYLYQKALTE